MNKSRRRTDYAKVGDTFCVSFFNDEAPHSFRLTLAGLIISVGVSKAGESTERRIVKLTPELDFLVIEEGIVVFSRRLDSVVFR
jgi:hypothetical protein